MSDYSAYEKSEREREMMSATAKTTGFCIERRGGTPPSLASAPSLTHILDHIYASSLFDCSFVLLHGSHSFFFSRFTFFFFICVAFAFISILDFKE